ncbi:tape measure protein [Neptunicella sp. SCSIO 80796]|uniref:tape measure protein n=1 Tax=Neptunicella plasticusilytica TaxID=3117012 RepID=UPI003A4E4490
MAMRLSVIFNGQDKSLTKTAKQAGNELGVVANKANDADKAISQIKNTVTGMAGILAGAFAANQLVSYADEMTLVNNKIRDVASSEGDLSKIREQLLDVSNATRTSMSSTTELYATLSRNAGTLLENETALIGIVDTVNKSFALSGASSQAANAAIIQLSQGLAAGALRGDEFNSVAEQAPEILKAVMKQTGLTKGELRDFAAEGKISSELLITSLQNYASEVDRRYARVEATIEQSFTIARNNLMAYIDEENRAANASKVAGEAIVGLSENIDVIADAVFVAAAIFGGRYVSALASAAIAKGTLLKTTLSTTPAVTGLSAACGVQARAATVASVANNALAVSARGVTAAMGILGGPAGVVFAAASMLIYFSGEEETATEKTREHKDELQKLIDKYIKLNNVGRQIEIQKLTQQEVEARNQLIELQRQYAEEEKRQQDRRNNAAPATNQFSGISQIANDAQELGKLKAAIDEVETKLNNLSDKKSSLFHATLDVDEINTQINEVNQAFKAGDTQRLDAAIASFRDETEAFDRELQLRSAVQRGQLSQQEADLLTSLYRKQDAYTNQYHQIKQSIEQFYNSEIEKAKGNADQIAQIEQEKSDRLFEIKRTHQDAERLLVAEYQAESEANNLGFWERMQQHMRQTSENFDVMWGNTFDRFTAGIGEAVSTAVTEGQDFGEAMQGIAKGAIKSVISGLVEIGVKKLALWAIEKTIATTGAATNIATAAATGTAIATAYAPAAAMASLASFGGNSIPAMAGITSTIGLAEGLSILGIAHDGLPIVPASHEGTYLLRRDEMVLNPKQRENFEQVVAATTNNNGGNSYQFNPNINIDAKGAQPGMEAVIEARVRAALEEYDARLQQDFAGNGPRSQMLSGRAA